jgi:Predicted xylanase/chitin deacetylase
MYHSVNHDNRDPNNVFRIPKAKFDAEMKWLYCHNYKALSVDDLYYAFIHKTRFPEKSVVITFDDGYKDNFYNAFPIMKKYHFIGTVFMITGDINNVKDGYLSVQQIKEMARYGISFEPHTVTHRYLSALSYISQYRELNDSKKYLEQLLGKKCYYMAYPFGAYNLDSMKIAQKLGYRLCFTTCGGKAMLSSNKYRFPRLFVGQNINTFINSMKREYVL